MPAFECDFCFLVDAENTETLIIDVLLQGRAALVFELFAMLTTVSVAVCIGETVCDGFGRNNGWTVPEDHFLLNLAHRDIASVPTRC